MTKFQVKIPRSYRSALFSVLAMSWCTGVAFFVLNRWFVVEGDFGPQKHPWQYPVLQVHGLAAFFMLMAFGTLLVNHVSAAWKTSRHRWLGSILLSALSFQIITAYLLYYLGSEDVRALVSTLHTFNGVCLPLVLLTHLFKGLQRRRKFKRAKPSD